ncbi:MAG: LysR family transcriptional regulator [candidate division NC10 bacterium]|nr:LysR family transcriptional regulator [candidate division NC10 bacterium]
MDIHALEVFCRIMELRSFSRAAEAVSLTQPTVSGHIKNLEEEAGTRLFDRLGKEVRPTKAGEILYRYATEILRLRAAALQALDAHRGRLRGSLLIGGSNIPGEYILPALLARFKARYPEIGLTLRIGGSREVAAAVADGEYEVGMLGARFKDPKLEYVRFAGDEVVLAVPAGHPWASRRRVSLADVAKGPLILREPGSGTRKATEEAFARAGVEPARGAVVAELGSNEAVRQAVRCGAGCSFISRRAIEEELKQGALITVPVEGLKLTRDFYMVTHRHRSRSPAGEAFRKFLLEQARP